MKRIYIDITQLLTWKGKVTGIQRVMYELSDRFQDNTGLEANFVTWHEATASFRLVNFEEVARNINQAAGGQASGKPSAALFSRAAKKAYSKLGRRATTISSEAVDMQSGSVLFMPHGGVWESQVYIDTITELKSTKNIKLAMVLYDMIPALQPHFSVEAIQNVFKNYMRQVLPRADLALSISKNTADDAKTWLKSLNTKVSSNIKVFRLGDDIAKGASKPVKTPEEFILCVGTIEARKNHAALYYAYKRAKSLGKTLPPIVVVGRKGWLAEDAYQLITRDPETKDSFMFLHDASDEELAWLYGRALFSIYPSFYEGWGLPIAESLIRGVPCIASDTSSMQEIGGDLVTYFSPYSPDQILESIEKYYANPALLEDTRDKVKRKYKATTWDMTYDQVSKEIQKL